MTPPVVQATGLVRSFGGRLVVDSVSFTLNAGDCLALFGPNGAGKTTLLRLIAGLLAPGRGSVHVNGVSLKEGAAARAQVGLVSHASMLYGALTVRENVELAARLYGLPDPSAAARSALALMRVDDRADTHPQPRPAATRVDRPSDGPRAATPPLRRAIHRARRRGERGADRGAHRA